MPRADAYDAPCCIEGVSIAPQGNFCQERQKSPKTPFETHGFKQLRATRYAYTPPAKNPSRNRSYFWGVVDSFTRLNHSNDVIPYIANRKKRNSVGGNVALTLLLFSLPHHSKMEEQVLLPP